MLKVATKNDIETIKKLYNSFLENNSFFKENAPSEEEKQAYAETFLDESSPNKMIILAYEGEEPIGMIAFSYEKDKFEIRSWGTRNMIWVEPEYQNKGYSKELMNAYETWARLMNCNAIQLDILHDKLYNSLLKSYKNMGFKPMNTTCIKEL